MVTKLDCALLIAEYLLWFHMPIVTYRLNVLLDPISDQSDIESRIRALKEELRKRKFMACQLKKEQRKRQKERLKAQEANLLKQLEVRAFVYVCQSVFACAVCELPEGCSSFL